MEWTSVGRMTFRMEKEYPKKIWKLVGTIIPNIWKVIQFMFQTTNQLLTISLQTSLYVHVFFGYCGSKPWCPNTKIGKTKTVYKWMLFRLYNFPFKHGFDMLWSIKPSLFSWRFHQYLFTKKLHLEIQKVKLKSPRSFETSHLASCFISGIVPEEDWSTRLLHLVHDRRGSIEERPEQLTDEFSPSDVGILCRTEMRVPKNGCFIMENPFQMDNLFWVPLF